MKDPTDTTSAVPARGAATGSVVMPRVGSPLWLYMTVVIGAGAAALAVAAGHLHGAGTLLRQPLFWVILIMIVAGEIWPIAVPGRSRQQALAASITIGFAILMWWGFALAILLRTAGMAAAALGQRSAGQAAQRAAFTASQEALSLTAAGLIFAGFGVAPKPDHAWRLVAGSLPVVLFAAFAYFAVGFALAAGAEAFRSRTSLRAVVRSTLPGQALIYLVLLTAAPVVTLVMATRSAVMVGLLAVPLAAIYLGATRAAQRDYQVHHDELTGLANRKLLVKRCDEELAKAAASETGAGLLLLDLDRFKEVNDTLGHPVGDQLLQLVAKRLTRSVRPGDMVARLGGDEFAVLLPTVREPSVAREVASRLRAALAEPVRLAGMTFDIQASVGIALFPDEADGFEQLLQRADVAMYVAKERRSGIERYRSEADRNSPERLALAGELGGAVHRREIELYFQPKLRLADGAVLGMEALARWPHPRLGTLAAAEFVGLAEQSHLASELTELVIGKALAQHVSWSRAGLSVQVCVNLPVRDLVSGCLPDMIVRALGRHGLPPQALRLEISEMVLATKATQVASTLRELADLGVGLSLDDFGTGYTSLAQLTRLGISEVKVDPALIHGLTEPGEPAEAVQSLIRLAQSLGLCSVAEGVETARTAAILETLGCDAAQGWHFCGPLTAAMARDWLAGRRDVAGSGLRAVSDGELAGAGGS
jgi:diguanylate cyclase (GGDEF)-like protein